MTFIRDIRCGLWDGHVVEIEPLIEVATTRGYRLERNPAWEYAWRLGDSSPAAIEQMFGQLMFRPYTFSEWKWRS